MIVKRHFAQTLSFLLILRVLRGIMSPQTNFKMISLNPAPAGAISSKSCYNIVRIMHLL